MVATRDSRAGVSPDGRWLYYQPCSGPLYRIDTRWLDDGSIGDAERAKHVERFADTPPTGGTGIDTAGNIYVSPDYGLEPLRSKTNELGGRHGGRALLN